MIQFSKLRKKLLKINYNIFLKQESLKKNAYSLNVNYS